MPKVVFITLGGSERIVDAQVGESVMSAAVRNGIAGIVGECGGNCSCATCHVYVDEEWADGLDPIGDMEEDLLDLGVADRRPTSRLACQIPITDAGDGLRVHVPEEQA